MNKLNNAEVGLELCRGLLENGGQRTAASALKGIEVHNVAAAHLALGMLRGITVYGTHAGHAKAFAIKALEDAVASPEPYGDA